MPGCRSRIDVGRGACLITTQTLFRHPEVRAERASKGGGRGARAVSFEGRFAAASGRRNKQIRSRGACAPEFYDPPFQKTLPGHAGSKLLPSFRCLGKREAERRQACVLNLRTFLGCGGGLRRSPPACRRSTTALARGSISSQRLSVGPGFVGGGVHAAGFTPPTPLPTSSDAPRAPVLVPAG
jgi:hypothetical protein